MDGKNREPREGHNYHVTNTQQATRRHDGPEEAGDKPLDTCDLGGVGQGDLDLEVGDVDGGDHDVDADEELGEVLVWGVAG